MLGRLTSMIIARGNLVGANVSTALYHNNVIDHY